jgi:hypothetical protein
MFTGGLMGIGALYDLFTLGTQVDIANGRNTFININVGNDAGPENWRYVNDGSARIVGDRENLDLTILKTARKNGGIVTPGEVAIEAHISLDKVRERLEKMAIDGHAEMRIRKSGAIVFTFPEFMDGSVNIDDL